MQNSLQVDAFEQIHDLKVDLQNLLQSVEGERKLIRQLLSTTNRLATSTYSRNSAGFNKNGRIL
ncbi:hypothetical protein BK120_21670 [Paenibacillus sp. FSL A5-0031]|nr:hypothetical protein BK120_21670 [Paenibacillus sp. FSL A5-0031]